MEIKKIFSVLATGALATAMLAACSSPSADKTDTSSTKSKTTAVADIKPEKGAKLVVWDNGDSEKKWEEFVAKQFTTKYGIPVTIQQVDHTKSTQKMEKDGPAGKGADVFDAPHDQLGNMVNAGLIYDNAFADEYKQDFMDAAVQATSYNDGKGEKMYGYPMAIETYGLLYNKDLVKKPAKTMDELFTQAKAFTNPKANKYGFMMEPANYYFVNAFVSGYGGYVFGKKGTDPSDIGLNNKGAVKAGELMAKINKELLPLKKEDATGDVIGSLFNSGKVMYRLTGPWDIQAAKDAGIKVGVTPLPTLDNGKSPQSFSGIKALYVNSYSKYPKAASLYAKFATSQDMLLKRYEMTNQIPPQKGLLNNDKIKNDDVAMAFLKQAENSVPMPSIPAMQLVWPAMETSFTSIWNQKEDPKKALDAGVKQINEALKVQQK